MISWLQKVLQKHYKWLFSIMLVIIIIAFVFTIGGSPGIGHSKVSSKKQMYFGINLNDQEELRELFRNANISNILNTGQSLSSNQMAETLALTRPALLFWAKKLEIIKPNEFELTEYIKTRPLFLDEDGNFDPKKYTEFIARVKTDKNLSEHVVREVLTQDKQMDAVANLFGGPGYNLPFEAQFIITRKQTLWSVDIATLNLKDLDTNINIPEDKLEEHYQSNNLNFATPPQIEVAYTLFPIEQYLSEVSPPPADEEVKDLDAYKKDKAERLAAEAANDFQVEIISNDVAFNSEEFKKLLKKYNVSLVHLPPFNKQSIPKDTPLPRELLKEAPRLNERNYYSDVAQSDQGAFMLFFKKELPSYTPPLQEIKDEIKQHYLAQESHRLLESKAKILDKTLVGAVKADKSFTKVAKDEGLTVTSFNNFKILESPQGLDKTLLTDIQKLSKGQVSPFIMRDDRIYFIHVSNKEVPTVEESDPEVQTLFEQLNSFSTLARTYAITNELITNGLQESEG